MNIEMKQNVERILKVTKKSGNRERDVGCCLYETDNLKNEREITDKEPLEREKERCSGSYRQAVGFLVIKDDSISERPS